MKIGLLTSAGLSGFSLNMLMPVLKDETFSVELAVIDDSPKKTIAQKIKKNLRRGRGGYVFVMAFQSLFVKKDITISTEKFCRENGIAVYNTKDICSAETINRIRNYNLDVLLLVGGYGIIKEPLLSLTPFGILSYHHGNMRKYRGQPPAFWELYHNEKEMGITVQILASVLDCGIPVKEKTIEIKQNDTLRILQNRAMDESVNMMYEALKILKNLHFVPVKIETFGKLYTLPDLRQWIVLNLKIFWRRLSYRLQG